MPPRYPHRLIGLTPPRDQLYAGIDARVDAMLVRPSRPALAPPLRSQQAIGYAELHEHLAGRLDLSRAIELIKRNSRHYARRQLSWYRGDAAVEWGTADRVDLDDLAAYLRPPPP